MPKSQSKLAYTTAKICRCYGVPRTTLLRWEEKGAIPRVRRDKEGNRVYEFKHFKKVGKILSERLLKLADQIRRRISDLDPNAIELASELDELLAEYAYISYLADRDEVQLEELKLRAKTKRLPDDIQERIVEQLPELSLKDREFADFIEILHSALQSSRGLTEPLSSEIETTSHRSSK